jgi:S-adenosylmethionine hydrolase
VDPASLVRLDLPAPVQLPGCLEASVVLVDTFGNAQLLAERCDLEAAIGPVSSGDRLTVEPADGRRLGDGDSIDLCWRLAYAEADEGEPLVCLDSYGRLALAVNLGSAAATYGLSSDRRVRIRRS